MSDRINNDNSEFDVIGDILETLRFRGSIFFRSKLAAPWGMSFPQNGLPIFHIALSGGFFIGVGVDEGNATNVQPMDIVVLPNGEPHWIADQPGRELIPSDQASLSCKLNQPIFQQGEITNRLMCGIVHYDKKVSHPILSALPQIIHFPEIEPTDPIWMLVVLIDAEMHQTQGHGGAIVDRLTEALFLKLINHFANRSEETKNFLTALRDRRIHQALMLIHQDPSFNWSLTSLSEQVGMSRATLTRRFQDTINISPITYITNWRVSKAYSLIKYTNTSLEQIAESVGFSSARTLSKAFQRQYNFTPNQLRKNIQTDTFKTTLS